MAAGQLDTLKYICGNNSANPEHVRAFRQRIFTPFMDSLTVSTYLISITIYGHQFNEPFIKTATTILCQPAKIPPHTALSQSYFLGGLLDTYLDQNLKKMVRR
jgi:hypothetical protein